MLTSVDTPYADTRADALSFALGLAPLEALAVLSVQIPGGPAVELRLLGASHQVLVAADGARGPNEAAFSETVACLPGDPEPLPGRMRASQGGWAYDFTATTVTHDDDAAFGRAVRDLLVRLDGREDALTGTFPGSPYAVTALALSAEPLVFADPSPSTPPAGRTGWRTWHAYPQTREIVMTRSRLVSER
ncbi:DUF2617 family protein [Actinomadura sp. 9N407]|uniref:DUF2617 family protein n=1 Tax=Actinomadura sp. 9N407 TaxID=3375154 RepID=UPI00378F305D